MLTDTGSSHPDSIPTHVGKLTNQSIGFDLGNDFPFWIHPKREDRSVDVPRVFFVIEKYFPLWTCYPDGTRAVDVSFIFDLLWVSAAR